MNYIYQMKLIIRPLALLFCAVVLLNYSCKNEAAEVSNGIKTPGQQEVKLSKKDIQALKYEDYALSNELQKLVVDWNGYEQVASSVSFLKTADVSFFKSDIEVIKTTIANLRTGVPTELNTDAVLARLTVVETTFLKLQNNLTLNNITKDTQLESIKEVLVAWSNLTFIMNKKIEFESNDVDRPEQ